MKVTLVLQITDEVKVLQAREGFLSDHEVYEQISTGALNSRKRKSTKDQPGNLQTIQLEVRLHIH